MEYARIRIGVTNMSRVYIYPLRRKLYDTACAMQRHLVSNQNIEPNSALYPYREPTSDEILEFSDDGTIFGYIEVLDALGAIDGRRSKTKSWPQQALYGKPWSS